jgi:hypothetical protein
VSEPTFRDNFPEEVPVDIVRDVFEGLNARVVGSLAKDPPLFGYPPEVREHDPLKCMLPVERELYMAAVGRLLRDMTPKGPQEMEVWAEGKWLGLITCIPAGVLGPNGECQINFLWDNEKNRPIKMYIHSV